MFDPPAELPRVVLIGGGVHATVVADCIRTSDRARVVGYLDLPGHDASSMQAISVDFLGSDDDLERLVSAGSVSAGILGFAGLAHLRRRSRLAVRMDGRLPQWWTTIHRTATVADSARIDEGAAIFAGAVVNPLSRIGRHVVVNTCAVVEHHAAVGDFAVIGPHATLCGGVHVGPGVFVGAGAVVITDVRLGIGSVIGAGAVVIRDVPDHVTVAGNPARILERASKLAPADQAVLVP